MHTERLSSKKIVRPTQPSRPDIARKRARWKARQHRIDPKRLVFIDETWIKTSMAPLRGWGSRGQRLEARVPWALDNADLLSPHFVMIVSMRHG